ncbi:hypothetical protein ACVPPR_09160 [Dellaglioa sp. L3N]
MLVKKLGLFIMLCSSLLVTVGCGNQAPKSQHESSKSTQKASSESAQKASSESAQKASSESAQKASSESAQKASSESTKKATNLIDSSLIGTWYGYNSYKSKIDTIKITGNKITTNGDITELHPTSERTAADKALLAGSSTAGNSKADTYRMHHWGSFISMRDSDGRKWLDVRGWYQSAGDGTYYGVKTRLINGHNTPVLTLAGGAGIWASQHFYPTMADAKKMTDTKFNDEHTQD